MELTAQTRKVVGVRSLRSVGPLAFHSTPRDLWNRHGGYAYALACALLGSEAAAADAVAASMADLNGSGKMSDEEARSLLAGSIYRHASTQPSELGDTDQLPQPMVWLSRLARLQRASLALCVYGGLTHREAASLLDVSPATVAELITAGLKELGRLAAADAATCA